MTKRYRNPPIITAEHLRAMRLAAGLSQRELAAELGYVQQQIGHWERGSRRIPDADAPRIVTVLHTALRRHQDGRARITLLVSILQIR